MDGHRQVTYEVSNSTTARLRRSQAEGPCGIYLQGQDRVGV
jgi:hypothetical protein